MKKIILTILATAISGNLDIAASDQSSSSDQGLHHGYRVVHGWPQLQQGRVLGAVPGVGIDTQGNIYVFHRNDRTWPPSDELATTPIAGPTVTVFDSQTGMVVAQWGDNTFAMPHGLTVDRNDNVWLTDVALHQVYKYTIEGELLLTLGERGVSGDDAAHFNRPTDVAVAADGTVFISDGYRNTRVMEFSPNGSFVGQWGTSGDGPGEFNVPHGLSMDNDGRIYVADRENDRIQVFDQAGYFLEQWKSDVIGRPYGISIAHNSTALITDGGEQPDNPPDRSGVVILNLDGSTIERFGRWGNYDGQFQMAHDVAMAKDGAVYVADIIGGRVQKFVVGK
ncbi:MAG TPA: peptidyl-alpha-hydroxyglycine alpha-amidating lyase family protein [Xanthomonadales bacterium]|nr:peptidyl-alpha-hydroxyglycine alpha-amidating lyase family protein [Xanthomonadales bacterium]